jgi:hypothetical protein
MRNLQDVLRAVAGRMVAEDAKDTSDSEIYRTVEPCVAGRLLVETAKKHRALLNTYIQEIRSGK